MCTEIGCVYRDGVCVTWSMNMGMKCVYRYGVCTEEEPSDNDLELAASQGGRTQRTPLLLSTLTMAFYGQILG